mmetsp:Transcript_10147/g.19152  ORF Transcript_10147/g.19152 Transcript_10147/m.19152 type:complete len:243 (+) Transcript_10147:679-1407(+)
MQTRQQIRPEYDAKQSMYRKSQSKVQVEKPPVHLRFLLLGLGRPQCMATPGLNVHPNQVPMGLEALRKHFVAPPEMVELCSQQRNGGQLRQQGLGHQPGEHRRIRRVPTPVEPDGIVRNEVCSTVHDQPLEGLVKILRPRLRHRYEVVVDRRTVGHADLHECCLRLLCQRRTHAQRRTAARALPRKRNARSVNSEAVRHAVRKHKAQGGLAVVDPVEGTGFRGCAKVWGKNHRPCLHGPLAA